MYKGKGIRGVKTALLLPLGERGGKDDQITENECVVPN
jgi:hypothetical protein